MISVKSRFCSVIAVNPAFFSQKNSMRNSIIFYFIVLLFSSSCRSIDSKTEAEDIVFYENYYKSSDTYSVLIHNKKAGILTYIVEIGPDLIGIRTKSKPGYKPPSPSKDVDLDFGYRYEVFMVSWNTAGICEPYGNFETFNEENYNYHVRFYSHDKSKGKLSFISERTIKGNRCLEEWYGVRTSYPFASPMKKVKKVNYRMLSKAKGKKIEEAIVALYEGKSIEEVNDLLKKIYKK
ncbi:hypothetical protein AAG747_28340 [Rapidithrix thailandica]|uniref:Lipoprotein n=1 Tax=Rapidithrix thailandica TaxID=413964 RepID=A0AAW9SG99_9BACT